jgi:NADH-quinone oxidoreductase subunit M
MLLVFAVPLIAAAGAALAGRAGRNPRGVALGFALGHLFLTALLTFFVGPNLTTRGETIRGGIDLGRNDPMYRPVAVPGDPGLGASRDADTGETAWGLLPLADDTVPGVPPPEVQFYLGLDGLNLWLVGLTSFLGLIAVLVSWHSVTERPGGYYAWLFVLQACVIGAFTAFDVIAFYVFFELTLVPTFFLIGSWGVGGNRRDAARTFFLYTLFGSLFTLVGLIGVVLENPTPLHPTTSQPMYILNRPEPGKDVVLPREGPVTFSVPRLMQNVSVWTGTHFLKVQIAEGKADAAARAADAARANAAAAPADESLAQAADAAADAAAKARGDEATARADQARYKRVQVWLFVAMMIGFAVKIPILPLHTWLPAAYAEAPPAVTMLLAGVLAKLGTFGVIRIVLPLAPDAALAYGLPVFGTLGAIGIVYAALCAFAQRDLKLLVAYSSVSHLGLLVLGLFAFNREGLTGAALHMVNHGLSTGAMFALLGFLACRYRTLDSNQYGGLIARFPAYAALTFVISLASVGLPGLNNFVSEMLILAGVFAPGTTAVHGQWLGVAAASGIFLSAWYTMTMLRRVFFGPTREPPAAGEAVPGMSRQDWFAFALPAALCVVLGLFPTRVLETMTADVNVVANIGDLARYRAGQPVDETRRSVGLPERGRGTETPPPGSKMGAPKGGGKGGKGGPKGPGGGKAAPKIIQ